ncbi:MAG: phosphate ABC transporter substrate-binding protein [Rhizobium sp.]|nr:MAG: phosphate ABC transporter substrate-binding protein [Rhizobium sp.]
MYNLSPKISGLWDRLFHWLADRSDVRLEVVAHAAPAPLSELWGRPDMGAVFMCGFPFSRLAADQRPQPLAAPVSLADWAEGQPVYASHIVAASDRHFTEADLSTARWGWTVQDSQSGYHAPREFFAQLSGGQPARQTIGPLLNPRGVVEAIRSGTIDVGAIDAYAYQLWKMHEPEMVAPLRVVATTKAAPFPLLVAARQQPPEVVEALRTSLLGAHRHPEGLAILSALGLCGFAQPDAAAYDQLPARASAVDETLGPW